MVEKLNQQKENLRHRILRLRLQIEGRADDSIEGVVKRLAQDFTFGQSLRLRQSNCSWGSPAYRFDPAPERS